MELEDDLHPAVRKVQQQPRIEQRSGKWYKTRGKLLTASDAAAALDIKPFESFKGSPREELVRRKAELAIGIETFTGNDATRHGQLYEDEAIRLYEERTGEKVLDFGLLIHPEHEWLGGSPDGITKTGLLIEVKSPKMRKIIPDYIPGHYAPQASLSTFTPPVACLSTLSHHKKVVNGDRLHAFFCGFCLSQNRL